MAVYDILKKIGKTATHDRNVYWEYQRAIGRYYWETILAKSIKGTKILDIGCGEGGILSFFAEKGFQCFGLDNNKARVEFAQSRQTDNIKFINVEIENFNCDETFDLVLMLDVIEHVKDKTKALLNIKRILGESGIFLLTFPPYRSPFGGHQQVLHSFLKYIPYWHVLPRQYFLRLLKKFEKTDIDARLEIYDRGMTIKQFERLIHQLGFICLKRIDFLVRPRQGLRFGTKIVRNRFPLFRELFTTGVTYLLKNG